MADVNTGGTYVLKDAQIQIDVGGTPFEVDCAAAKVAVVPNHNTRSHPRTGCTAPYDEYVDSTWTMTLAYTHGFGTDGLFNMLWALRGTTVDIEIDTDPVAVSSPAAPLIQLDEVTIPAIAPIPDTDWGEFAQGEITFPLKNEPVIVTA